MNYSRYIGLNERLNSRFAVLKKFPAIGRNWQDLCGSHGFGDGHADERIRRQYCLASGPVTASVKSISHSGSLASNRKTVQLKNATGISIGKSFRIGVQQEFFDSISGTASAAGKGGLEFLHVPFTGANFPTAFPVKELGFGALISSKAGKFGGSFGNSGLVASGRCRPVI
jgi:hypothetical protein